MRRSLLWAIPLLLLGVACSDSTVPEADLVGTWNATAFVFSDFNDPVTEFDVVAEGGTVTIAIRADNTFTLTFTIPGSAQESESGAWSVSGDRLLFDEGTADEMAFDISLSGNTFTIYTDDVEFDFGNGEEPAEVEATFVRQ